MLSSISHRVFLFTQTNTPEYTLHSGGNDGHNLPTHLQDAHLLLCVDASNNYSERKKAFGHLMDNDRSIKKQWTANGDGKLRKRTSDLSNRNKQLHVYASGIAVAHKKSRCHQTYNANLQNGMTFRIITSFFAHFLRFISHIFDIRAYTSSSSSSFVRSFIPLTLLSVFNCAQR